MKRRKKIIIYFIFMFCSLIPFGINSKTVIAAEVSNKVDVLKQDEYRWNDFTYWILEDGTCEVSYEPYQNVNVSEITYPREIEGKMVSSVYINSFYISDGGNITKISLPDTMSQITAYCGSLTNLETIELYGTNNKTPPLTIKNLTFADSVKNIDKKLLGNVSLVEKYSLVYFPLDTIKISGEKIVIDEYAFGEALQELEIVGKEVLIEEDVFSAYYVKNLKSLYIEGISVFHEGAFSKSNAGFNCLEKLELKGKAFDILPRYKWSEMFPVLSELRLYGVKSIGDGVFEDAKMLSLLELGEGLISIGSSAFEGCVSLKEIALPNSVQCIKESAFRGCSSLEKVTTFGESFAPNIENSISGFAGCERLKYVEIPKSMVRIEAGAFRECQSLISVVLPESIMTIGHEAFYNCSGLTSLRLSNNISTIGNSAFEDCYNLKFVETYGEATMNEGEGLGSGAFGGCWRLQSIQIPQNITQIGNNAFSLCVAIKSFIVPNHIKQIGVGAFYGCELSYLELSEGFEEITEGMLYGCSADEVRLPASVKFISELYWSGTYEDSSNLYFVVDEMNLTYSSQDGVLFNKDKTKLLSYPGNKEDIYYIIPNSVQAIGKFAFRGNEYLEKVEYPKEIKEICERAFSGSNIDINNNRIPDSVRIVGDYAFASNMFRKTWHGNNIIVPASVESIGNSVYSDWREQWQCPMNVYFYNAECKIGGLLNERMDEEGWTIYGYPISTAYDYAKQYGLRFCDIETGQQLLPTVEPVPNLFADVNDTGWEYPFVKFAVENELMKGKGTTDDGKIIFDPSNNMTRAKFVQTLYNKEGKPEVSYQSTFTDVPDGQWYTSAIMWASQNGIVAGKGDKFDVSGNITRQEMATILCKYATNYKKYETAGRADVSGYTDVSTISSWATENMKWAVQYGIMKGKGDKLAPQANASRAECATMLKNFMDAYE